MSHICSFIQFSPVWNWSDQSSGTIHRAPQFDWIVEACYKMAPVSSIFFTSTELLWTSHAVTRVGWLDKSKNAKPLQTPSPFLKTTWTIKDLVRLRVWTGRNYRRLELLMDVFWGSKYILNWIITVRTTNTSLRATQSTEMLVSLCISWLVLASCFDQIEEFVFRPSRLLRGEAARDTWDWNLCVLTPFQF